MREVNELVPLVPFNSIHQFYEWMEENQKKTRKIDFLKIPSVNLHPCKTESQLREEIDDEIRKAKTEISGALQDYIRISVIKHLKELDLEELIKQEKMQLEEEIKRLENEKYMLGTFTKPKDYLSHAVEETKDSEAPFITPFVRADQFMMISSDIAAQWDNQGYEKAFEKDMDVYECGMLDAQEFELLQIKYYTSEGYHLASLSLFPLAGYLKAREQ
jgi:hypothetical protein